MAKIWKFIFVGNTDMIKFCKFCRTQALEILPLKQGSQTLFRVRCQQCEALGPTGHSWELAVERWNKNYGK